MKNEKELETLDFMRSREDSGYYLAGLACSHCWSDLFETDLIEPEDLETLIDMGMKEPRGAFMTWGPYQHQVAFYDDRVEAHRSLVKEVRACASELRGICEKWGLDSQMTPVDLVAIACGRFDRDKGILDLPDSLRLWDELCDCVGDSLWDADAMGDRSQFFRDNPETDNADWALCGVKSTKYYKTYVCDDDCPPKIVENTRKIAWAARGAAREITKYLRKTFSKKIAPSDRLSARETLDLMLGATCRPQDPLLGAPSCVLEDKDFPIKKEEYMRILRKRAIEFFEPVERMIGRILETPEPPKRPKPAGMRMR